LKDSRKQIETSIASLEKLLKDLRRRLEQIPEILRLISDISRSSTGIQTSPLAIAHDVDNEERVEDSSDYQEMVEIKVETRQPPPAVKPQYLFYS
jgi:hypothetical protein